MRWLWKDWPAPIKAGAGSPQLQEIVLPGETWKLVAEGLKQAAGLAANAKGEVVFTDAARTAEFSDRSDRQGRPCRTANRRAFAGRLSGRMAS